MHRNHYMVHDPSVDLIAIVTIARLKITRYLGLPDFKLLVQYVFVMTVFKV